MIGIDIGNTNITFGRFIDQRLVWVNVFARKDLNKRVISKALPHLEEPEPVVICSVAPEANYLFLGLKQSVYWIGRDLKVPINSFYDQKKVGADRLVAAYAAKKIEPLVRLIIDFGTAITIDFLSKKGDYQGGLILPGINSTLKTLKSCSLLPNQIKVRKTKRIIPKTTLESINKGLFLGFSQMLNGVIQTYQKQLKYSKSDKILVTGGDAALIKPYFNFEYEYEKYLVLKGLSFLANELI